MTIKELYKTDSVFFGYYVSYGYYGSCGSYWCIHCLFVWTEQNLMNIIFVSYSHKPLVQIKPNTSNSCLVI